LELVAHSDSGFDVKIVPAPATRDWMVTSENYAGHCLPLLMANQSGWFVLAPHAVIAEWNGGPKPDDLRLSNLEGKWPALATSREGSGILTWLIPYVFRTPRGWNLLCRGPANCVKEGLFPLEGLVETDWSCATISMNWKFTRPGRCTFQKGEPVAMIVPHRRRDLEAFVARFATLDQNPAIRQGYESWMHSRNTFQAALRHDGAEAIQMKVQGHYFRGCTSQGIYFPDHQTARKLACFRDNG
jgi:antitoxin (DNA-binding transcriptional repressor) of toxin-antitoxin stability system